MRVITQLAIITVAVGVGSGAWMYRDQLVALWAAPAATAAGPSAGAGGAGARPVPVVTRPARTGPVEEIVEAVGTTLANESVTITSRVAGIVREIQFQEGQDVKAGQVLLQFDDRESLAELEQVRSARELARQIVVRSRTLLEQRATPQARVDEQEQALRAADARVRQIEAKLQDLTITAPFAGKVGIRRVSVGALVQPGAQITTLDDTSVVKLRFLVPETALASVEPGARVAGISSAYRGRTFEGQVRVVDTRIDPVSRSVEVRADLPNGEGLLKPGMFMTVQLVVGRRPDAVLVPEEAIVSEGTRHFVFVVAQGRAARVEVKLGTRVPGEVEIREGLSPGAQVVVAGVQRIRDGSPVRPAEQANS